MRDHPIPAMSNGPRPARIKRSIAELETLAAFLADKLQRPWETAVLPLADRRLYKEALLTISVLLPKLQAVRRAHEVTPRCECPDAGTVMNSRPAFP